MSNQSDSKSTSGNNENRLVVSTPWKIRSEPPTIPKSLRIKNVNQTNQETLRRLGEVYNQPARFLSNAQVTNTSASSSFPRTGFNHVRNRGSRITAMTAGCNAWGHNLWLISHQYGNYWYRTIGFLDGLWADSYGVQAKKNQKIIDWSPSHGIGRREGPPHVDNAGLYHQLWQV